MAGLFSQCKLRRSSTVVFYKSLGSGWQIYKGESSLAVIAWKTLLDGPSFHRHFQIFLLLLACFLWSLTSQPIHSDPERKLKLSLNKTSKQKLKRSFRFRDISTLLDALPSLLNKSLHWSNINFLVRYTLSFKVTVLSCVQIKAETWLE